MMRLGRILLIILVTPAAIAIAVLVVALAAGLLITASGQ
jgi:hypothetical protein